jgi:Raf kinase inhibitor-like YbhB/YbcL family protein
MPGALKVTSTEFEEGGTIPSKHAHSAVGGENVSPPLSWSGVPDGTQSIAVSCYDPDAPTTIGFSHWVLANLPPDTTSLPAGAGEEGKNPPGSVVGVSDWGDSGYGGMGPPPGDEPHRYQFTVYALDVPSVGVDRTTSYAKFRFLIREHILATGTLTGRFGV